MLVATRRDSWFLVSTYFLFIPFGHFIVIWSYSKTPIYSFSRAVCVFDTYPSFYRHELKLGFHVGVCMGSVRVKTGTKLQTPKINSVTEPELKTWKPEFLYNIKSEPKIRDKSWFHPARFA